MPLAERHCMTSHSQFFLPHRAQEAPQLHELQVCAWQSSLPLAQNGNIRLWGKLAMYTGRW